MTWPVNEYVSAWVALTPEEQSQVLVRVFGPDFPMDEVERILVDPTVAEFARYRVKLREVLIFKL